MKYCYTCQTNTRGVTHLSTKRHRRSTREHSSGMVRMRERPAWMIALHRNDEGTDAENAAAAARLGVDW